MVWTYDKQGKYDVKSGYQVVLSLKFKDQPSSSRASPTEWNAIWKLEIPEKLKVFMWRATQDLLPMAGNLWKRKFYRTHGAKDVERKVKIFFMHL